MVMTGAALQPVPLGTLDEPESELVLGLVYAVGTDDRLIENALGDHIKKLGYRSNPIRLSRLLKRFDLDIVLKNSPEHERISSHMDAGNRACAEAERADFLALVGVSEISKTRPISRDARVPELLPKTVHIVFSLKRPDEVLALRRIYGQGFFLIGAYAGHEDRMNYLVDERGCPRDQAELLEERDQAEGGPFGQQTRDTFHLADVFVHLEGDLYKQQLFRFLDLVFGKALDTPTPDENAMFLAYAASLRSASLSRQVGAAVATDRGEVVAVGCNDVPCAGGGLHWPGEADQRDHIYDGRVDTNAIYRDRIVEDVVKRLLPNVGANSRLESGKKMLGGSPLMDITEYGRAVHAEMEAILACARAGISPVGCTLYTTTFPCHNCTRHIVAAGIKRVVYIEPYSRSQAMELHADSIEIGRVEREECGNRQTKAHRKVAFEPFVGVGPRRYFDLFSMRLSSGYPVKRKTADGRFRDWDYREARPRVPMLPRSYLQLEQLAVGEIRDAMKRLEEKTHGDA